MKKALTTFKERFMRDKSYMEDGMIRTGDGKSDIWQNQLVWAVCLTLWDILEYLLRKENIN